MRQDVEVCSEEGGEGREPQGDYVVEELQEYLVVQDYLVVRNSSGG